jgi:hypothetical protein
MQISSSQYWNQIQAAAESLALDAMQENDFDKEAASDAIFDNLLHEYVDGHQWIIYNAYNLDVIQHSDNADYYVDNFGCEAAGEELKNNGLSGLHTAVAFWCMYADIADKISDALDEVEQQHESEEE